VTLSSSSTDRSEDPDPEDGRQSLTLTRRIKYLLFGKPRDLRDSRLFHRLSLVPFLAWVEWV
jgi:hypothetical protein